MALIILFLLVFVWLVFISLVKTYSPSDSEFRSMADQLIQARVGGTVHLEAVELKLLPLPYLHVQNLQIQRSGDMDLMIQIPEAEFHFNFVKMLAEKGFHCTTVVLKQPWIFLQKNEATLKFFQREQLLSVLKLIPTQVANIRCLDAGMVIQDHVNRFRMELGGLNLAWTFSAAAEDGSLQITQKLDGIMQLNRNWQCPVHGEQALAYDVKKNKLAVKGGKLDILGVLLEVDAEIGNISEVPVYYIHLKNERFNVNEVLQEEPFNHLFPNIHLRGDGEFELNFQGEINEAAHTRFGLTLSNLEFKHPALKHPLKGSKIKVTFNDPKLEVRAIEFQSGHSNFEINIEWPFWYQPRFAAVFDSSYLIVSELPDLTPIYPYMLENRFKANAKITRAIFTESDVTSINFNAWAELGQATHFELDTATLKEGSFAARGDMAHINPARPDDGIVLKMRLNLTNNCLKDLPYYLNLKPLLPRQPAPDTLLKTVNLQVQTRWTPKGFIWDSASLTDELLTKAGAR